VASAGRCRPHSQRQHGARRAVLVTSVGPGDLADKLQAGVIVSDYATLMVEILKDNARPEAAEVYGAMDLGWARRLTARGGG